MKNKKIWIVSFLIAISFLNRISVSATDFHRAIVIVNNNSNYSSLTDDEKNYEITIEVSNSKFDIEAKGEIKVSENDKDIEAISPEGFVKISKSVFGNQRTILIESDKNGTLTRKYFVGKNEEDYQSEGKQWLAEILPEVLRSAGIAAEQRVERIYQKNGMKGLLQEIDQLNEETSYQYQSKFLIIEGTSSVHNIKYLYYTIIVEQLSLNEEDLKLLIPKLSEIRSNSTKGTLLREILYRYTLNDKQVIALLETANTLEYNTERGSILRLLNPILPQNPEALDAYFKVIANMEINSEKGNVIKHLLEVKTLNNQSFIKLLESLGTIASEREKGAILLKCIPYLPKDKDVEFAFFEAVKAINKHYYVLKSEIMNTYLKYEVSKPMKYTGDKSAVYQVLDGGTELISSSQIGELLRQVNRNYFMNDIQFYNKYKNLISAIENNLEKYNVLLDFIDKNKLDEDGYLMVLDVCKDLLADDYQHAVGAVLRKIIPDLPINTLVINSFFEVVQRMDQNATIEEVLRYLYQQDRLIDNKDVLIKTIESSERIDVDIERASVLSAVREFALNGPDEVKYAYKSVARTIKNDYFLRKVSKGLDL